MNIASHLTQMARLQPYKRAVVFPSGRDEDGRVTYSQLTFRQLDMESDCLAHGLDSVGITRGTRTVLMVPPSLNFFTLTFALFKTGAIPVVVDPGMGIQRMLSCLKDSRPEAFIGIPKAHAFRMLHPTSRINTNRPRDLPLKVRSVDAHHEIRLLSRRQCTRQ